MKRASARNRSIVWSIATALLLVCAAAGTGHAAQVTLEWDPNPAGEEITKYTLYEDGSAKWSGTATTATLETTPGVHRYTATATNVWGESEPSEPAVTPGGAQPPAGLRVSVVVDVTIKTQ